VGANFFPHVFVSDFNFFPPTLSFLILIWGCVDGWVFFLCGCMDFCVGGGLYVCVHACVRACVRVCECVCVRVRVYMLHIRYVYVIM